MAVVAISFLLAPLPVVSYHIDGAPLPVGNVDLGGGYRLPAVITSADWLYNGGLITACENNGVLDDRLGGTLLSLARPGIGGLCTTGENDATGEARPPSLAAARADKDVYVKLDICDSTTVSRNAQSPNADFPLDLVGGQGGLLDASGPYPNGGNDCASGSSLSLDSIVQYVQQTVGPPPSTAGVPKAGRTNQHDFSAQIGAFACTIPTDGAVGGPAVTADFSLYYSRLYAWWSYDGIGWYTQDSAPGDPNSVLLSPNPPASPDPPEDGADLAPGDPELAGNGLNERNNEEAYTGHVSVFINLDASKAGASLVGSVETKLVDEGDLVAMGLSDDPEFAAGGGGVIGNNCGASPSSPPSGGTYDDATDADTFALGPVLRAPNLVAPPRDPRTEPVFCTAHAQANAAGGLIVPVAFCDGNPFVCATAFGAGGLRATVTCKIGDCQVHNVAAIAFLVLATPPPPPALTFNWVATRILCDTEQVLFALDDTPNGIASQNLGTKPEMPTYVCEFTFRWDGINPYQAFGECTDWV